MSFFKAVTVRGFPSPQQFQDIRPMVLGKPESPSSPLRSVGSSVFCSEQSLDSHSLAFQHLTSFWSFDHFADKFWERFWAIFCVEILLTILNIDFLLQVGRELLLGLQVLLLRIV